MTRTLTMALAVLTLSACGARDEFDPWGARGVMAPESSLTVSRITGGRETAPPLLPEPGNVWPVEEAPRATLMNPDQQERFLPRPGSSTPPPPLSEERPPQRISPPLAQMPNSPPSRRTDGRVLSPGGEVITGGPPGGHQTFTTPGGGSGVAVPQGPDTILLGPDGQVRVVPTPR